MIPLGALSNRRSSGLSLLEHNLWTNPRFDDGMTGWSTRPEASLTVTGGIATLVVAAENPTNGVSSKHLFQSSILVPASLYYLRAWMRGPSTARLRITNQNLGGAPPGGGVVSGTWGNTTIAANRALGVDIIGAAAWPESVEVDDFVALNLTAIYGAGNEPDKATVDAMITEETLPPYVAWWRNGDPLGTIITCHEGWTIVSVAVPGVTFTDVLYMWEHRTPEPRSFVIWSAENRIRASVGGASPAKNGPLWGSIAVPNDDFEVQLGSRHVVGNPYPWPADVPGGVLIFPGPLTESQAYTAAQWISNRLGIPLPPDTFW